MIYYTEGDVYNCQRPLTGVTLNTDVFIFAPAQKSKITSEELDLCKSHLVLEYVRRSVDGHAIAEYKLKTDVFGAPPYK